MIDNMEKYYNEGENIILFLGLLALIFLVIIVIWLNVIIPFSRDREYIKMEIERSFNEDEYKYWKSELRQLYLSYIPLIGRFFR